MLSPLTHEDLLAREQIRDVAALYMRAIDRKDMALLRDVYTHDGFDQHWDWYSGSADGFVEMLAPGLPNFDVTAHYLCNHLISVAGANAEGEAYGLAYLSLRTAPGVFKRSALGYRYIDRYRRDDGVWRISSRVTELDWRRDGTVECEEPQWPDPLADASYKLLTGKMFQRWPD